MPGYDPSQYLTNTGFNQLTNQLGLRGTGGGWNPALPLQRRAAVGLGHLGLQQIGFANEIEPMRQMWARQFLMNLNPSNIQARIDALMRRNREQASQNYERNAAMAPFVGVNPASLAAYHAQADRDTAAAGQMMRSPGGMADAFGQGFQAMNAFQDPSTIMALANVNQSVQSQNQSAGRNVPNQSGGLGGLFGTIGQIAGMGGFNNLGGLFNLTRNPTSAGSGSQNPWVRWAQAMRRQPGSSGVGG